VRGPSSKEGERGGEGRGEGRRKWDCYPLGSEYEQTMPAASRKGDTAKAKGGEQAAPANKRPAEEMMDVEEESSGGVFLKGVPVPKAEKNASKVLADCWKDRCMGVAMLFRARG